MQPDSEAIGSSFANTLDSLASLCESCEQLTCYDYEVCLRAVGKESMGGERVIYLDVANTAIEAVLLWERIGR